MYMKFRYPKGIPGGILKYGFNMTAIINAWSSVFVVRDAQRMQARREARLKREAAAQTESEREPDVREESDNEQK